jgi:NADPH-dependent glutamate synthase beta subunit-like oxidoreductase
MHIPDYLKAIAEGRFTDAVKLFYDNNPLPEMCGKVCTRQCETVCAMGYQGESIAIRWLKRFACEQFESLADVLQSDAEPGEQNGRKVAVIGAGPSGLTAAYYLSRKGYEAHVFDGQEQGGGVAWRAIPQYRLPRENLKKQMEVFEQAGVIMHYGENITKELLTKLSEEYHAVYIAAGLQKPSDARIEGEEHPGVKPAFNFLMSEPEITREDIGRTVLVIGGGNVAMDTARTCRRLGAEVTLSYRRRMEDMPADNEEIHEAIEEHIDFRVQTIPKRIEKTEKGLKYFYLEARMEPNPKGGRPVPVPKDDVEHSIEADTIFTAIGQTADLGFIPEEMEKDMEFKWDRIVVNELQYTGSKNIFAGGDITPGAGDAITAIADGLRAVKGIEKLLS